MKKILTLTVVLTAVTGLTLSFAGPQRYEQSKEVTPLAPCNWQGFYVGLNIGAGTYEANITDNEYFYSFDSLTIDDTNVLAGGQFGYNWQKGAAVFGIEADGDWTNFEARSHADPSALDDFHTRRSEIDFMGTVRGRMGLAYENVLAYVTAGVAFAGGDRSVYFNEDPDNINEEWVRWSGEEFRVGWTAGVGIEYMANCHWSVRLETLFADFVEDDNVHPSLGDSRDSDESEFTYAFDDKVWSVRVGVNYMFGGGR